MKKGEKSNYFERKGTLGEVERQNISAMHRIINNFGFQTINFDRARRLFSLVQVNNIILLYKELSARLFDMVRNEENSLVLFQEDIISTHICPTCLLQEATKQLTLEKKCFFIVKSLSLLMRISSIFNNCISKVVRQILMGKKKKKNKTKIFKKPVYFV